VLYAGKSPQVGFLRQLLQSCKLFTVFDVKDRTEYNQTIKNLARVHVYIVQDENQHDPYFNVARSDPFRSSHSAANATSQSAHSVLCSPSQASELFMAINRCAIESSLISGIQDKEVLQAVDMLFTHNPVGVIEWSELSGMKIRKFQRKFKDASSLSPKKILALYHAYRMAFYYCCSKTGEMPAQHIDMSYTLQPSDRKRILEYVLMRKSTLLKQV